MVLKVNKELMSITFANINLKVEHDAKCNGERKT